MFLSCTCVYFFSICFDVFAHGSLVSYVKRRLYEGFTAGHELGRGKASGVMISGAGPV
jgi:hypothetical protein